MKVIDQKTLIPEVLSRVENYYAHQPNGIENILIDTFYDEKLRLENGNHVPGSKEEKAFYRQLQKRFLLASTKSHRAIFQEIIQHFVGEIVGHFDSRVYHLATKAIPTTLNFLLHSLSPLRIIQQLPHGPGRLEDHLFFEGRTESLRKLAKNNTIILAPTHASNLDSVLLGYMLYRLGLPPFLYGAGLNLFSNKVTGFFMDHLGAYTVDRRKKSELYKRVLKTFAGYALESGFHSLFFPGGTRSRSGAIESKLKLGLLGMGLDAYIHHLQANHSHPDIFIVPCTINYQIILEAESLIKEFLRREGKSRFLLMEDEFSQARRVLDFLKSLFDLDSPIHMVIGQALDVFGNPVDDQGQSLDPRGRPIDRRRYVFSNGKAKFDPQRDQEYTRELEKSIVQEFKQNTLLSHTHLVSKVMFDWLRESNPELDFYRLLRSGGLYPSIALSEFYPRLEKQLKVLKKESRLGKYRLANILHGNDLIAILSDALAHLTDYHLRPVLYRRGDQLFHRDRHLLYFYQNRIPQ